MGNQSNVEKSQQQLHQQIKSIRALQNIRVPARAPQKRTLVLAASHLSKHDSMSDLSSPLPPAASPFTKSLTSNAPSHFHKSRPLSRIFRLFTRISKSFIIRRIIVFVFCIIGFLILSLLPIYDSNGSKKPAYTLATTFLMCILWVTQSIPLAATSLIPIFTLPLLSVMSGSAVSAAYVNHISMIFIGGFVVALAMERWHLHRRVALFVICKTLGGKKKKIKNGKVQKKVKKSTIYRRLPFLLFGFTLTAWFFSQWVSNTATALIFVPNALAIVDRLEALFGKRAVSGLASSLFIGIAASCNIGGLATIIGTPSNLIFLNAYSKLVPGASEVTFMQWFLFALPLATLNVLIMYLFLLVVYTSRSVYAIRKSIRKQSDTHVEMKDEDLKKTASGDSIDSAPSVESIPPDTLEDVDIQMEDTIDEGDTTASIMFAIRDATRLASLQSETESISPPHEKEDPHSLQKLHDDYKSMGWIKYEEMVVLTAFFLMAVLWATRSGMYFIPGWEALFPSGYMNDGTVAILVGFCLFCIPAWNTPPDEKAFTASNKKKHFSIMDWSAMKTLPWDIILLFGGGFAIAEAFTKSELDVIIGRQLFLFANWPPFLLIFMVGCVVWLVTCVVSNVATTTIFMPITYALSKSAGIHPLMIMIPATVVSSFAFFLPTSTGPNMIAFASHRISMLNFMMSGAFFSLVGVLSNTIFCYIFIPLIFGIPIRVPVE